MQYVYLILFAAVVFGLCFLVDKGFSKFHQNRRPQHTGSSVRYSKRVMAFGIILFVIGIAAILNAAELGFVFYIAGALVCLVGVFLMVLYASYSVYYDEDTFTVASLGKKRITYSYGDILTQTLYNNAGSILIELHMADGSAVHIQAGMENAYPFMDKAFSSWLLATGRNREDCPFHEPEKCRWFPVTEE